MFVKIIKWIIGIFLGMETLGFFIMMCCNFTNQFVPWLLGTLMFGFLTFLCFKKPKEKINTSSQFPVEVLKDMKNHYPKKNIPVLVNQIKESIHLVETTTNVETLLTRREFALQRCMTLKQLEDCGLYKKKPTADQLMEKLNLQSFNIHLKRCYDDYFIKAHQLKTANGIQKRMDKFWNILNEHLDEYTVEDFKDTL